MSHVPVLRQGSSIDVEEKNVSLETWFTLSDGRVTIIFTSRDGDNSKS